MTAPDDSAPAEKKPRKKRKKASTSPTKRSLDECRKRGWRVQVVEHWNPFAKVRQDLFGCLDLLALDPERGEVVGIQACALGDISKRITKTAGADAIGDLRRCGVRILVQGWGKDRDGKVRLREEDLS